MSRRATRVRDWGAVSVLALVATLACDDKSPQPSPEERYDTMNADVRRKRIGVAALLALALPFVAGGEDAGELEPSVRHVSLVAVLANPDAFDGREITLVGYVSLGFEEEAIWLMASDYENSVLTSSVAIGGPRITSLSANGYAEVKGVFHKRAHSHEVRAGNIMPEYIRPWRLTKSAKPVPTQGCSWFF